MKLVYLFLPIPLALAVFITPIAAQELDEPATIRTFEDSKHALDPSADTLESDGEYIRFKRWEYRMTPRLLKNGILPRPGILLDELGQYNATHLQNQKASTLSIIGGRWTPMGPFGFDSPFADNGGTGRVNVIRFHPSDTTKIFVGTPEGGLWKSENSGATWIPLTDNLPSLGVSDIAIDPKDPLKIYLATGDAKDAGMYGNPYSYGIMKTTNGGQTWSKTGLSWDISERMNIPCVVVSPTDSKIVLAGVFGGSQRGIQKSIDGGTTWEQKDGGSIYHIVYNPADPALIYASGYGNFRRSTDGGDTWTTVTSILPTYVGNNVSRTLIGVTPADPNVVYVLYISHAKNQIYGLYRSTDRGLNFTQVLDTSKNLPFGNSGEYNLVLAVSPIDANTVVIGEQFLAKSTDGGKTWASIGSGVHVDNHAFVFTPHAGLYYSGNDGGIFRSSNGGKGWTDISAGLQITQFYRLGGAVRQDLLYAGAQDNGVQKSDGGIWDHILPGADGGECLVDYSDENIVYMEWQNGDLFRSDDAGASTSYIAPSMKGYWITPYLIHPTNPETIYAAYQDIYKSTNRGDTWKSIGHLVAGNDEFKSLALAPSNDNVIYAGTYIKLFKTTNGGSSWQDITAGSPTGDTAALTYIAVSPTDPQKVWLTFSGFTDHKHVYTSSNGGISWTNITGTLPNVPVNTIIYESGSNDGIYIGTDIGVFYRDKTMTDWEPFITELPNVSVTELEINETSGMIRAATFGRGMWQSPLRNLVPPTAPRLIAPANTATAVPQQPTFIWGRVMRTSKYHFELAKDSLFTSIVMDRDSMSDTTFAYPISLEPGTKYFWRTGGANAAGESLWSETWSFRTKGTSGVKNADRQTRISAYPNPFSTTTTFSFMTDNESPVVLDIADLLGRTIENRTYGELGKGFHEIQFDGRSLTAGSYIYSIRVGGKSVIGILRVLR